MERIEKKRPKTLEELKAVWYNGEYPNIDPSTIHYHESRYHGLNLHNVFYRHTIEFRYFEGTLHAGKIKAYVQLVLCLAKSALKAASAQSGKRPYNPASGRYDFRVLLNRLGMTGPEFATARLHLLSKLAGDCAFKNGRPAR